LSSVTRYCRPPRRRRANADSHHRSARQSDVDPYAAAAHHHADAQAVADAAQTPDELLTYPRGRCHQYARGPAAELPNPNARITSPGINQIVKGNVAIHGTANGGDFQYYKIEVGLGRDPNAWTVVGDLHYTPVDHGQLETFNSSAYGSGTYTLRLVVVDNTGNYPEPCRVTVIVQP